MSILQQSPELQWLHGWSHCAGCCCYASDPLLLCSDPPLHGVKACPFTLAAMVAFTQLRPYRYTRPYEIKANRCTLLARPQPGVSTILSTLITCRSFRFFSGSPLTTCQCQGNLVFYNCFVGSYHITKTGTFITLECWC